MMMIFVIPQLTSVLKEVEPQFRSPRCSLAPVTSTEFLVVLVILIVGAVVGARFVMGTSGKNQIDRIKMRCPFGSIFQRIYLVRFSRSLYAHCFASP